MPRARAYQSLQTDDMVVGPMQSNGAKLDIKDARGRTLLDAMQGLKQGEQIAQGGGRDSPSTPEMVNLIRAAMGLPPEAPAKEPEAP